MRTIKANVVGIYVQKFDENLYQTLSLRLNKNLKIMRQNENGEYKETETPFLSMPLSAALAQIDNEIINYYLGVTSSDEEHLRIALSSSNITVEEALVEAGTSVDGFGDNTEDHDQYFHVIKSCVPTKLGKAVIAANLGVDVSTLA